MFLHVFLISLVVFIICDLLWLGVVAKRFYQERLGYLLGEVNWYAAAIFYLIFIAGLTYFATLPGIQSGALWRAVALGAFFGLVTYATYDLTNHATIKDWPVVVTVVDILWGMFLGAFVSGVAFVIYTFLQW